MRICVIDGRGGGLGARLVRRLSGVVAAPHELVALGTNQAAAAAMARAGASRVGVGHRALWPLVAEADLILGPLSIVLPGAMVGEITAGMAAAILRAPGRKLLLPLNRSGVRVVGTETGTLDDLMTRTIEYVQATLRSAVLA